MPKAHMNIGMQAKAQQTETNISRKRINHLGEVKGTAQSPIRHDQAQDAPTPSGLVADATEQHATTP
eukprot:CAMPEP_0204155112 /NCGR_PEP_ID=MMETSP0361-20130328/29307_1 /ASSEMBLY_ACC=CAM_ASM_000343 /TAXON_ID=268821 /ORGANISM="Scrippsiella Hangoei, Strain SHTV-5" /LENGTH=66 /DNA_ID=CAMNT_0051110517 /DNA_START=67 /DNA_END=264 /DNA_ORIENTATION=+